MWSYTKNLLLQNQLLEISKQDRKTVKDTVISQEKNLLQHRIICTKPTNKFWFSQGQQQENQVEALINESQKAQR